MDKAYELQFVIASIDGHPIVARIVKFQFPIDAHRLDHEIAKILIKLIDEGEVEKKDVN